MLYRKQAVPRCEDYNPQPLESVIGLRTLLLLVLILREYSLRTLVSAGD